MFGGVGIAPGIWLGSEGRKQREANRCAERALAEGYVEVDEKTFDAKGRAAARR